MTQLGYETEGWRQPTIQNGDTIIFSEHGRSVNNVCFKSHWLMLVKAEFSGYYILVKHGAGEERISVGYGHTATGLLALSALDADQRYLVLYTLYRCTGRRRGSKRMKRLHAINSPSSKGG